MLVRFSEIVWDLDEPDWDDGDYEELDEDDKEVEYQGWLDNLPALPVWCVLDVEDGVDLAECGADLLSDKFEFCVQSFQFSTECWRTSLSGLPVTVAVEGQFLYVYPEGYGEPEAEEGCGSPVFLEVYEGRLRVIVSPDIREEKKRFIIDLQNAREREPFEPSPRIPEPQHEEMRALTKYLQAVGSWERAKDIIAYAETLLD